MEKNNRTFVLVHGGWHGGWAWERLVPYLVRGGCKVFTPDLTGLGEKVKLANPDIGLSTHIRDILTLLDDENLHNVTLVGHSYGGMVITGVADKAAERIAQLVYLDAHVPKDGQSFGDIVGPQVMNMIRQTAKAAGQGWLIPIPPPEHFGIASEADIAFVKPKLMPQPIKTLEEPIHLSNPAALALPRTYIYLNQPALGSFDGFARMARSSKDWRYYEMATGHDAMILEPQKLAELFIKIANDR
jgi:pimeloyl-ACP methyl ester carboxylesterase